jgi:ArsR family transcriptional regulator
MLDSVEVARVLDILGNRNRRRIIELLRQKPCFVTEISDRLMLSPKAVIEHLQLMEREEILGFRMDERRRKYYFLSHDISVMVDLRRESHEHFEAVSDAGTKFRRSLLTLNKMVQAREEIASNLEHLDHDIDQQIREIAQRGKNILRDDTELDLVIALTHYHLTLPELVELTGKEEKILVPALEGLMDRRIIERNGSKYKLRDAYGE